MGGWNRDRIKCRHPKLRLTGIEYGVPHPRGNHHNLSGLQWLRAVLKINQALAFQAIEDLFIIMIVRCYVSLGLVRKDK